jgi:hypothetical protein
MTIRLTVREAANRAGVCPSLIYNWCSTKLLAHYRVGAAGRRGKIVIDETELDSFLQRFRVEAAVATTQSPTRVRKPALKHLSLS